MATGFAFVPSTHDGLTVTAERVYRLVTTSCVMEPLISLIDEERANQIIAGELGLGHHVKASWLDGHLVSADWDGDPFYDLAYRISRVF